MGVRAVIEKWKCRIGIVVGLVVLSGGAQAERAYVTDRLQLGVHMQADTSDRSFATLKSGEVVDILEENRYHALVVMADGRKGWVKKNYLVKEKPAILRVAEVEQERDKAIAELESLASSLSDREARVSEIEAQVAEREAGAAAEAEELKRLRAENVSLSGRLEAYSFSVPGALFFVAVAACLVIGCLLSWWWFDYRSRQRHGGYRVH
jgi:SH3 domain protein